MKRLAIVQIADSFLSSMLRIGTREAAVAIDPLPADAQLIAVHYDGRNLHLTYESAAFDPVEEGMPIPYYSPMFMAASPGVVP